MNFKRSDLFDNYDGSIESLAQGKMGSSLLSGQQFGSTGSLASASDTDQVSMIFIYQSYSYFNRRDHIAMVQ